MRLYELAEQYRELEAILSDDSIEYNPEEIMQILEQTKGDIYEKIDNISSLIKSTLGKADLIKGEKDKLDAREKRERKNAEALKEYLATQMLGLGETKFENARHKITFRKSESLYVDEEKVDKSLYVQEVTYKLPKKELKDRLKKGEVIEGLSIVENQNIQIK